MTLLKKVKNHQRIKQMKRMAMKQNQLSPLNPLTTPGLFQRRHLCFLRLPPNSSECHLGFSSVYSVSLWLDDLFQGSHSMG